MSRNKRAHTIHPDVHVHQHSFSLETITGRSDPNAPETAFVDRSSDDHRRHYREPIPFEPPSPLKRSRLESNAAVEGRPATQGLATATQNTVPSETYRMDLPDDDDPAQPQLEPSTAGVNVIKPSDPALHRFRSNRDRYSARMLRRDGRLGANETVCPLCKNTDNGAPLIRCKDCFGDQSICATCCVDRHAENPLHRVEWLISPSILIVALSSQQWNGSHFQIVSLKSLSLRVQLGHPPRTRCPSAPSTPATAKTVSFAGPPEEQLLTAGWFPATDIRTRTCTTFACMDLFVLSTQQSKTTIYNFYKMLEKLSDNSGGPVAYRYHAFLRMCREYPHLLMLKRAGVFHEPGGVGGTQPGRCAIKCPCCPRPGVNLPEGWENASPEDAFLYIIFLVLNACFRLKRRMVSSELKDPSLGPGWSYMVESKPYRAYLLTVTDQKEMSTCSGLAALDYANTKFAKGYSSTGVGMGVCARHEFVQPNGVGDLQKGERYANMDYIFASILRHVESRLMKIVSYDIVCQWWQNLKSRISHLPPLVRFRVVMAIFRFVIPKLHIHAHTMACQLAFSLNLVPGSAQTDGEGIERPWANIGGVASSMREMTPGSREEVLNNHWGFWNWQKLLALADRIRTRLDRAKVEYAAQLEAFTVFSMEQDEHVAGWLEMVDAFEADGKKKNPYEVTMRSLTEAQVLLKLEEQESQRLTTVPAIHRVSPSAFVAAGLEVEEQQRRVRLQADLKKAQTTAQQIDLVGLWRDLSRNIRRLRTLQATYTPAALLALVTRDVPDEEQVETEPLFLPSALSTAARQLEPVKDLAEKEEELRRAQCGMALVTLRNQLHIKSRLLTYKQLQSRNQGANTRARGIVTRNEGQIRLHSEKYQMARDAIRRLCEGDLSKVNLRALRQEDIRCMEDAEDLKRDGEKCQRQTERRLQRESELRAQGELPPLTAEERESAKRSGGENAYAHVRRWREELRLLEEEARRLPISLEFEAKQWEERVRMVRVGLIPFDEAEGAIAYGVKQAAMFRRIAERVPVTMTEVRLGRGKRRRRIDWEGMDVDGGQHEEDEVGADDVDAELDDLRGNESDEEHILGGGLDDD
ncbi:hypothetical protein B0H16DRAFT_1744247 [Mycena metata]|uniref:CxC2-like cysteine cluster KDZ transposase-associated domain-containing protein n=1 Tax=Mycena metata TaxID=1033252 RepID=A0AAD7H5F3_9AGAR|nr:hypothetical protein B0H16DRAFT_1744247 [Mycena metata]